MPHIRVAIQGEEGSYHDIAARHYFGAAYAAHYKDTFEDVFEATAANHADYGLSAVENSLVGAIPTVYDLLRTNESIAIVGEIFLGIHHSLLALPGAKLDGITDVYSHPVALGQCTAFLKRVLPHATLHSAADTAGSAVFVKAQRKLTAAAIAGAPNAGRLGLAILAEGIENNRENYTRFLTLQDRRQPAPHQAANKTSLLIERLGGGKDDLAPGILHQALGCFAAENIPLTNIQSRPVSTHPWRYVFYIDCLAGSSEPAMRRALAGLTALNAKWRELGTYPAGVTIA